MTQEDKRLLLIDLCARLPYGVECEAILNNGGSYPCVLDIGTLSWHINGDFVLKPYLRPMSSITKEEREEVEVLIFGEWFAQDSGKVDGEGWIEVLANYDISGIDPEFCSDYVDWLNAHHFDFRNLIKRGLAIEAPSDMYKI